MKTVAFAAVLSLLGSPLPAQVTAITDDGRRVILDDDGTWRYEDEAEKTQDSDSTLLEADPEPVIKAHCGEKWPADFEMLAYCDGEQRKAHKRLSAGNPRPDDIPENIFETIRSRCREKWSDDFQMREYCEGQQFDAYLKVR